MKKIIIITTILSLASFGLVLPVAAEENRESNNQVQAFTTSTPAVWKGTVVMTGTLVSLSAKTLPADLTVKVTKLAPKTVKKITYYPTIEKIVTVHLTDKTNVVRKYMGKADLSELALNDNLMVTGKLNLDGTLNAQLVKDNSIHVTFSAQKGLVTAIDTANNTFTIKKDKKDAKEYKVYVTPNTKFAKAWVEKPTLADMKVGSEVKVRGVIRQKTNEITADSVVIQPTKEEITARVETKKNEAVKKNLEKRKENLGKQLEKKQTKLKEQLQKQLEEINKKLQELNNATTTVK